VKRKQSSKTSPSIVDSKKDKPRQLSSKGFEAFGVTINSEVVRLCSLYISTHLECGTHENEGRWTRVNMIARDRGSNIVNMDNDGYFLADSLEMVLDYLYLNKDISHVHAGKMEEVVGKLREAAPIRHSQNIPSPQNGKKRKSNDSDNQKKTTPGYESEVSQSGGESEYGDDVQQVVDPTDDDEEEDMTGESDDDSQSTPDTPQHTGKGVNQADEKTVFYPDEESDGEHYDPQETIPSTDTPPMVTSVITYQG
jgi:hypothetical protein